MPRVTVLMPVFNAAPFLEESIRSVLGQTLRELELIVVNDGSTDESGRIARDLAATDRRVLYLEQSNQGASAARNHGLAIARADYIAAADADDIQLPQRLARQVAFLDRRPDISVCGGWLEPFGANAGPVCRYPTDDARLRCQLLFDCPIAHPTVMFRREVMARHQLLYRAEFTVAHDYDLWVRAASHCQFANLPEVLVRYRQHAAQLTSRHRDDRVRTETRQLWALQLGRLGLTCTPDDLAVHERLSFWQTRFVPEEVEAAGDWLARVMAANAKTGVYPAPEFARTLGRRWHWVCANAVGLGPGTYRRFRGSPLAAAAGLTTYELGRFWLKCRLRRSAG
jgi:glycosyltransferase involved in cell wall biosynthesis